MSKETVLECKTCCGTGFTSARYAGHGESACPDCNGHGAHIKAQPARITMYETRVRLGIVHDVAIYIGKSKANGTMGFEVCHAWGSDFVTRQSIERRHEVLGDAKDGVIDPDPTVTWSDVHTLIHEHVVQCEPNAHDWNRENEDCRCAICDAVKFENPDGEIVYPGHQHSVRRRR